MADERDVKKEPGSEGAQKPRPALPPIRSSSPAGGGGAKTPTPAGKVAPRPLSPAPPVAKPATPTPAPTPQVAPPSAESSTAQQSAPVQPAPRPVPAPSKPATEIRKPKQDRPPENDPGIWRMSRKNFLNVAGWFAFFSFLLTATLGAIRLMVPRVLYEPPSAFKAGFPQDYVVGEVNEKYKDEFRVWIVRELDGFYALSAICTHLGCTPRWLASEEKFKCPCHGSGYHKDGVNFEGPTPRPLERLKITLADDGQILVDRNIKFLYEKGEWSKPDAFLKFT
jgi:cytochrome b6-f complex iron-sulfur subunit